MAKHLFKLVFLILLGVLCLWAADWLQAQTRLNGGSSPSFGAVTATTVDTGQGANKLYDMDQNVLTASTPQFAAVNVGADGAGAGFSVGNGTLITTGRGDGTDEAFTLGLNASNIVTVSSTTGVATWFYSGIVVAAPGFYSGSQLVISDTAPTISSGFGTTPSISAENGTAAFRINVGTGGVATTGVIGLPAATTGWNCHIQNLSANTATVFLTKQTASSTTTATIGNYDAAGAAAAWTASNILAVSCFGL